MDTLVHLLVSSLFTDILYGHMVKYPAGLHAVRVLFKAKTNLLTGNRSQ